jgi:hypothetical protein
VVANLGGFAGPYIVGWVRQSTGNLNAGLSVAGFSFFVSATLALLLPRTQQLRIRTDQERRIVRDVRANELVGALSSKQQPAEVLQASANRRET